MTLKKCSWCGEDQTKVDLVPSINKEQYICINCINALSDGIKKITQKDDLSDKIDLPTPSELKKLLDDYVIGQDDAKKVLSVAVYNHYKRINYNLAVDSKKEKLDLDKSNILMIGPTGSGKTMIAKTLAKILKVPFAQADATTLTQAGYVGDDVENILLKLIANADYDIKKAEKGIIYIDEIDKITKKGENMSITRDVSGEGVQQALLKIIESTIANIPPQGGRKNPYQPCIPIDTTNILFICGGAFVGLEKVINSRINTASLGFNSEVKSNKIALTSKLISEAQPQDLVKYGLIPEFVGRLPIVVGLDELDEKSLVRILTEPKNALIKQYQTMFKIDGVDLEFTSDAINEVSKKAIKLKTGARGLRTILESTMLDLMFMTPDDKLIKKIVIDKDVISSGVKPTIIKG